MENTAFGSIDRLIEFGIGMAIAQQMVQTMNHAMQNMHVAGTMNTMQTNVPNSYYLVIDEKQAGPFSEAEMVAMITQKKITNETYVWHQGMSNWEKAENTPTVLRLVALAPPPFNK